MDGDVTRLPSLTSSHPSPTHYHLASSSPSKWHDSRPRWRSRWVSALCSFMIPCLLIGGWPKTVQAAFINFENCLEETITQSDPLQLQFIPFFLSVRYDLSPGPNPLTMTVYGNVSGLDSFVPYPPPDSPDWTNPNVTTGKIQDIYKSNNTYKYSTLFTKINVLTFTPYDNPSRFCDSVTQGDCPLGPVFYKNS